MTKKNALNLLRFSNENLTHENSGTIRPQIGKTTLGALSDQ